MQRKIQRSLCSLVGAVVIFGSGAMFNAAVAATDLDLVCSGNNTAQDGSPFESTESIYLKTKNDLPVLSGMAGYDDTVKSTVLESNDVQIKFTAMGMVAEYYRSTGSLFLIHDDGRLIKFICKPRPTT